MVMVDLPGLLSLGLSAGGMAALSAVPASGACNDLKGDAHALDMVRLHSRAAGQDEVVTSLHLSP